MAKLNAGEVLVTVSFGAEGKPGVSFTSVLGWSDGTGAGDVRTAAREEIVDAVDMLTESVLRRLSERPR